MAIDVCSEISTSINSPRISFSHDLNQADNDDDISPVHERLDTTLLQPNPDSDFCFGNIFSQELFSSADELFSNGKILPVQVQKVPVRSKDTHKPVQTDHPAPAQEKKSLKELLSISFDAEDEDQKPLSKSFWQFKRSSSLNCESVRRKSLMRSLQFLSRSNSTGSALNLKQQSISKETQKPNLQKQSSINSSSRRSSSASGTGSTYYGYSYSSSYKNSARKSFGSNGNGVKINHLLNLTPQYISKATVSFFGFGSLFCNCKVKKKQK